MTFDHVSFENDFACSMDQELAIVGYLRRAKFTYTIKTQYKIFFLREYRKGIHLGRHLYTGIKTFSFLCGRVTHLVTEGEHQVLNGSHIFVLFTRILLLFGTKCHYSCKRRHDEEGNNPMRRPLETWCLLCPTICSTPQRKVKLLTRVFNRHHLFKGWSGTIALITRWVLMMLSVVFKWLSNVDTRMRFLHLIEQF